MANEFEKMYFPDEYNKRRNAFSNRKKIIERRIEKLQKHHAKERGTKAKIKRLKVILDRLNRQIGALENQFETGDDTDNIVRNLNVELTRENFHKMDSWDTRKRSQIHAKTVRLFAPLSRISRISKWEEKRDKNKIGKLNKQGEEIRKENAQWLAERIVEKKFKTRWKEWGFNDNKITDLWSSLSEWIVYLRKETVLNAKFRAYVFTEILDLEEGENGKMRLRKKKSDKPFPKFNIDKVNKVLGLVEEFFHVAVGELKVKDADNFIEDNYEELEPLMKKMKHGEDFRQLAFKTIFEKVDELTEPKEYVDLSTEFKINSFSGGQALNGPKYKEELDKKAKQVAEICKNSRSFCIAGLGMAKTYLENGDLHILTRMGTNVKTGVLEPVPDLVIYCDTVGMNGHINEIRGNEFGQDLHPRNVLWLKEILQEEFAIQLIKDPYEKSRVITEKHKADNLSFLKDVIFYYFYHYGIKENKERTRRLDNVIRLKEIYQKLGVKNASSRELENAKFENLDTEDFNFLEGRYGHTETFSDEDFGDTLLTGYRKYLKNKNPR